MNNRTTGLPQYSRVLVAFQQSFRDPAKRGKWQHRVDHRRNGVRQLPRYRHASLEYQLVPFPGHARPSTPALPQLNRKAGIPYCRKLSRSILRLVLRHVLNLPSIEVGETCTFDDAVNNLHIHRVSGGLNDIQRFIKLLQVPIQFSRASKISG